MTAMNITIDDRSRLRVLLAASSVKTRSTREAAIIGGIAQSVLQHRPFDPVDAAVRGNLLLHRDHAEGSWPGDSNEERALLNEVRDAMNCELTDARSITSEEMRVCSEKFVHAYHHVRIIG